MTMPEVSAPWATAYVQSLVALLVFVLGIPAIIRTLDLPEYLRRMRSSSERRMTLVITCAGIGYAIMLLLFMWVIHPSANATQATYDLAGTLTMTVSLVAVIVVCASYIMPRRDRRYEVVKERLDIAHRSADDLTSAVADLVYIGERSLPGMEKDQVLQALSTIMDEVQSRSSYAKAYEQMDGMAYGIERILLGEGMHGTYTNFHTATRILERNLHAIPPSALAPDVGAFASVLGRIGVAALDLAPESEGTTIAMRVVDAVAEGYRVSELNGSARVRAIGRVAEEALLRERFVVVSFALHKLCAMAAVEPKGVVIAASGLSAVAADLWLASTSSHAHVSSVLGAEAHRRNTRLRSLLLSTAGYYVDRCNYRDADDILSMLQDMTVSRSTERTESYR